MQVRVGEYSIRVCPISHYSPVPQADWGIRLILSPQSLPLGQRRCGATTASKCGVDGQVRSWWQNHLRPCGETLYPAFFLLFARLSKGCTRSCYLDYATRRSSLSDGRFYQPSFCKMQKEMLGKIITRSSALVPRCRGHSCSVSRPQL